MRVSRLNASAFILLLSACNCGDPKVPFDGDIDGTNPNCGNSALDDGETCDDANNVGNDGCSSLCVIEMGYTCPTLGQACIGCGDDIVQPGEACDDGENVPDDGCSATCQREPGWDCIGEECTPSTCGDGIRVGPEDCDDGNKVSGDGCSIRCDIEPGYVCVTPNFPCRLAVCGDGAVEAQEQCDDGDADNTPPGCDGTCHLVPGFHCPTPGVPCVGIVCGDGVVQGLEQCDDANNAAPGCSATCQLEMGYHCPTPGQACVMTMCGNGVREGLEACDDHGTAAGDGCSATCTVEPFFECEGSPLSVCSKPVEFVRIAKFPAPIQQPQAIHYDPRTRSFVAYDFTTDPDAEVGGDAQEFCLDGTKPADSVRDASLEARRQLVDDNLDGAAYDPFRDRFLFIRQNGLIYEVDRNNNVTASIDGFQLDGFNYGMGNLDRAGGVQVGDDGRIYAANHYYPTFGNGVGNGLIRVFIRNMNGSINPTSVDDFTPESLGLYLDNIFNIPGVRWIGYYNLPDPALVDPMEQAFSFHRYDGTFIGTSRIPGILFRNGETFPHNADGGEAATDGGYFLVCSEYLDPPGGGAVLDGICQLFAQTCVTTADCTERVPGTICKLDEPIPYCYAPAVARDDRYTIAASSPLTPLDVLLNDAFADAVCAGAAPMITAVTAGDHGGTIAINGAGTLVNYTPMAGCGFVEKFMYTANLGGGIMDSATVTITVPCVCGNGVVDAGEECDGVAGTPPGRTCRPAGMPGQCTIAGVCGNGGEPEPGEQCDDGNLTPGDGCSPTCTIEIN